MTSFDFFSAYYFFPPQMHENIYLNLMQKNTILCYSSANITVIEALLQSSGSIL